MIAHAMAAVVFPDPEVASSASSSLTVAIVVVFALVMIYFPNLQQQRANAGFGPDWDCVVQAKGDPVCTKKPGR